MFRKITIYGLISGVVVGVPLFSLTVGMRHHQPLSYSVIIGYTTMLIALSAVFVAIKRYRDADLGGVISFWRAFGLGLGITFVSSIFYVLAWEAALAVTQMDFAGEYGKLLIAQEKAKGVSGPALAKLVAEMEAFKRQYANPLYRYSETFSEIFPVGVLVSVVSAALLRNSRFLPARRG